MSDSSGSDWSESGSTDTGYTDTGYTDPGYTGPGWTDTGTSEAEVKRAAGPRYTAFTTCSVRFLLVRRSAKGPRAGPAARRSAGRNGRTAAPGLSTPNAQPAAARRSA